MVKEEHAALAMGAIAFFGIVYGVLSGFSMMSALYFLSLTIVFTAVYLKPNPRDVDSIVKYSDVVGAFAKSNTLFEKRLEKLEAKKKK